MRGTARIAPTQNESLATGICGVVLVRAPHGAHGLAINLSSTLVKFQTERSKVSCPNARLTVLALPQPKVAEAGSACQENPDHGQGSIIA
jgi:hypothetical protein